jgi:hypothetical protein
MTTSSSASKTGSGYIVPGDEGVDDPLNLAEKFKHRTGKPMGLPYGPLTFDFEDSEEKGSYI